MPLYEYECANCRNHFEVRQRMVDDPITVCPTCGGPTKRVLYPAGIIFKGSGWYVTDSRKPDSSASEKTSSETKTESSSSTTSSSAPSSGESTKTSSASTFN